MTIYRVKTRAGPQVAVGVPLAAPAPVGDVRRTSIKLATSLPRNPDYAGFMTPLKSTISFFVSLITLAMFIDHRGRYTKEGSYRTRLIVRLFRLFFFFEALEFNGVLLVQKLSWW